MNNRYYEFLYNEDSISSVKIMSFLKNINSSFIPKWFTNEENDFNEESYTKIEIVPNNKTIHIFGTDNSQFILGSLGQTRLIPRRFGLMWRYIHFTKELNIEEIDFIITQPTFKIGFEQNQDYCKNQSDDNPQSYKYVNPCKYGITEKEIKDFKKNGMPLYFNENAQMYLIDISQNPGREIYLPGMKFIPAYKIWYGKEAQDLFGKQKILDYPNAIYIKELENGIIEMQLMDDINKCDLPYNQEKHRDIVKYFEIEKLEVSKY
jgi:hypothetical protein